MREQTLLMLHKLRLLRNFDSQLTIEWQHTIDTYATEAIIMVLFTLVQWVRMI